jgi:predicted DNA-binding transcriptional regulator YafY
MPPLLLEDDEAVAIVVSLRTAAGQAVEGIEETALRALTKLQQVLPQRLGRRVDALQSHTVRVAGAQRGPQVDGSALALIAAAARDREVLRFRYHDHAGSGSERRVEPYRLVSYGRRWYLVAFDLERTDWRTFRVDRLSESHGIGHRFALRPLPADDIAAYVATKTRQVQQRVLGRVEVEAPAEQITVRLGAWGSVEPLGPARCRVHLAGRSVEDLAFWLGVLDADFTVVDSPELSAAVQRLAARYGRAVGPSATTATPS